MVVAKKSSLPTLNYSIFKYVLFVVFIANTGLLFIYLNRIQQFYFIDEMFHIPQTLQYCARNFTVVNRSF